MFWDCVYGKRSDYEQTAGRAPERDDADDSSRAMCAWPLAPSSPSSPVQCNLQCLSAAVARHVLWVGPERGFRTVVSLILLLLIMEGVHGHVIPVIWRSVREGTIAQVQAVAAA